MFLLKTQLSDGGEKLRIKLKGMEAELERRNRHKLRNWSFDGLIGRDDNTSPKLLILPTPTSGKDSNPQFDNYIKKLSDKILGINKFLLLTQLSDGGENLRMKLKEMEAELERRNRHKV